MIIFRYLAKEVLTSMIAVSTILLLIIMSGRFVRYLAQAAAGKLDAEVLLTLMSYRLPEYLELILPLGLFISILLAYGRLYVDSEMTVLSACGMSERRLVAYTLIVGLIVASVVGVFSLSLGPKGVKAAAVLLTEPRSRTAFALFPPARFPAFRRGAGVPSALALRAAPLGTAASSPPLPPSAPLCVRWARCVCRPSLGSGRWRAWAPTRTLIGVRRWTQRVDEKGG